ncbi:hypothetical protein KC346_g7651, partial [Hortaea werneckii]
METLTISLDGSSDIEVYNIAPLSDAELSKTYRFSISFLKGGNGTNWEETVGNLSITHRLLELATDEPRGGKESGSSKSIIIADPATRFKATPENNDAPKGNASFLANNEDIPNCKTYIVGDPENGAARNVCSKDKVLGDGKFVLVSSQPLSFDVSEQSLLNVNKYMHASQHRLTMFRPELSYVAGLNAIWECRLALSDLKLSYDWSDNAIDPVAAALIEKGISSWNALFYSATQL